MGCWELSSPTLYYSSLIATETLGFNTGSSPTWGAVLSGSFPSRQPLLQTKRQGSCSTHRARDNTLHGALGQETAWAVALAREAGRGQHRRTSAQPAASAEDTLGIEKARLIGEGTGQALKAGRGPSVGYDIFSKTLRGGHCASP